MVFCKRSRAQLNADYSVGIARREENVVPEWQSSQLIQTTHGRSRYEPGTTALRNRVSGPPFKPLLWTYRSSGAVWCGTRARIQRRPRWLGARRPVWAAAPEPISAAAVLPLPPPSLLWRPRMRSSRNKDGGEDSSGGDRLRSSSPHGPARTEPPRPALDLGPLPAPDSTGTAVSKRTGFKGGPENAVPECGCPGLIT